jgi:hypothetical protein
LFDQAKDEDIMPWIQDEAWRRIKRSQTKAEDTVPFRFLLRWKTDRTLPNGNKANARVILQGFKHVDTVAKKLKTGSPTISRCGRNLTLLLVARKQWALLTSDVKSAFLQAEPLEHANVYGEPKGDMRKRLSYMVGPRDDEVLQMGEARFWRPKSTKAMVRRRGSNILTIRFRQTCLGAMSLYEHTLGEAWKARCIPK